MLNKMQLRLSNVKTFPVIAIVVVLAIALLLFGIYIIIPAELLGIKITSAYPSIVGRAIFGVLTAAPAIPILYYNIKYSVKDLISNKINAMRPYIFWMGVTYAYICILRILIAGWFPPIFLIYGACALISFIIWFANKYI